MILNAYLYSVQFHRNNVFSVVSNKTHLKLLHKVKVAAAKFNQIASLGLLHLDLLHCFQVIRNLK